VKTSGLSAVLAIAVIVLGNGSAAAAESVSPALGYEQTEDRAAFVALLRKARRGHVDAQWQVALTYARLAEDARALPLLLAAATSGHAPAASLAGSFLEDGRGAAKDIDQALRWYRQAARDGEPLAQSALARLLPADEPVRLTYMRSAADAGNPDGQYQLGLHLAARGKAQNLVESFDWLSRAATQGHVGAMLAVASQLIEGRGVRADRAAALRWLERAAKTADPVANYLLGEARLRADPADPEAARAPLLLAASAGHREAQFLYGDLLARAKAAGEQREALQWLEKAQRQDHAAAANRLGELLRQNGGDAQQPVRARGLFLRAAEQGNVDAMYNLADMQNQGLGGDRDSVAALKWFSRAAEEKHEKAAEVLESLLGSTIKTSSLGLKGFWQR
jgi:TPR repeat protein